MILLSSKIQKVYLKIVEGASRLICVVMTSLKQMLILMFVYLDIVVIVTIEKLYGK